MSFLGLAQWIRPHEPVVAEPGERPAHLLSARFDAPGIVREATLTLTAHGIAEVFINGSRVGDDELVPGFTSYRKRLQVFSYPAGGLVRSGTNTIEVLLSDGWFRGRHGFERRADGFGSETALLLELEVTDAAGASSRLVTDESWRSRPSVITRADLMDGQSVDFRLAEAEPTWLPVTRASGGLYDNRDRLIAPVAEPVRRIETITPAAVTHPRPGTAVLDIGQNINGWMRIADLGPRDTRLTLTHGEVLGADGLVDTSNLRAFIFSTGERLPAGQVDEVISAGRSGDVFEPRHTTHGFRFVQVDGIPDGWDPASAEAVVVHTALRPVGEFVCSDDRVNRLHQAGRWSFRDNACEIPTDCPQRERSGFTGDWQVFVGTAALLYDVRAFSEKWLADLAADQWSDGRVPTVIPNPAGDDPSGVFFEDLSAGSAGWGDAAAIVPWELWRHYGDLDALRAALPAMIRWVDYAASAAASGRHPDRVAARPEPAAHEPFLWDTGFHFGEWLEPGVPPKPDASADNSIVATAFLHRSAVLVAAAAALLGDAESERHHRAIAAGALDAWRAEFLLAPGRSRIESQANYARGLAFGLFPDADRPAAAARLAELVDDAHGHLGTGFLSTGQLLPALADNGQANVAYDLLLSDGVPSWLGMLDAGATTVWEWWDAVGDDGAVRGSLNHYSKAAVLSFLYSHVAGIRIDELPDAGSAGYRRVRIAPVPGGGLEWARASVDTPQGRISSGWQITDDLFQLDIDIPVGTTATVELDGEPTRTIGAGTHSFTTAIPRRKDNA